MPRSLSRITPLFQFPEFRIHPMSQPPLLPSEALARVIRLAKFDGYSVLVLGGLFALSSAAVRHFPLTTIGLLAAGAGAVELHGVALLRRGAPRGMAWLIASQPLLIVVLLAYAALRLWWLEIGPLPDAVRVMFVVHAERLQVSTEDFVAGINRVMAVAVALIALIFQGGMLIYYLRRRKAVARALAESTRD